MLNKLTIKNYRLFDRLEIDQLARVNLIVGTNNSGKSSLLEALHLLTSGDARGSLLFILKERGGDPRAGGYQISQVFHGRSLNIGSRSEIDAGNLLLRMSILETRRIRGRELVQLPLTPSEEKHELNSEGDEEGELATSLIFERHKNGLELGIETMKITDDGLLERRPTYLSRRNPTSASRLITTNYLDYNALSLLWDRITLTPREDKVVEALQILEPQVERISFTSRQTSNSGVLIRLSDEREPIPLGSMGDGMRRVLAIAASLVSVGDGTLLIDEVDTGLYYGVLKDMWRLIFETASKQNAQVFATTHSWDCVKAFQQALSESGNEQLGRLIRLDVVDDRVEPVSYSSRELDVAIEQGIEVR